MPKVFGCQKFSLRVLLSIYLIFCQFQPGVAYKGVAYIKERVPHASKCDQGGSFFGCLVGSFPRGYLLGGSFPRGSFTDTASEKKPFLIVTFLTLLSVEQNKHCTKSWSFLLKNFEKVTTARISLVNVNHCHVIWTFFTFTKHVF